MNTPCCKAGNSHGPALNFFGGRLQVEVTPAKPVPAIFSGKWQTLCARTGGTIEAVDLQSGTALVTPGQQVEAGQPFDRHNPAPNGTAPLFLPRPPAFVTARFEWTAAWQAAPLRSGPAADRCHPAPICFCAAGGLELALFQTFGAPAQRAVPSRATSSWPLRGFPCRSPSRRPPYIKRKRGRPTTPDGLALAMARLHCLQTLEAEWPGARIAARKEQGENAGRQAWIIPSPILFWQISYSVRPHKKAGPCPKARPAFSYAASFQERRRHGAAGASSWGGSSASSRLRSNAYLLWQKWHTTFAPGVLIPELFQFPAA